MHTCIGGNGKMLQAEAHDRLRGRNDIGVFPMPGTSTSVPIANVPPGIYYVRMRAVNAHGAGVASYDVAVIVP